MSVHLCIDCGNTSIKAGIFENNALKKTIVISETSMLTEVGALVESYKPDAAILCSVTEGTEALAEMLKTLVPKFIVMDGSTNTPINNAYGTPETLGADRLALVVAANALYPDKNNLVVCLGTCITYNHIQKTKTFRGGSISPGMMMRFQAMHEFTSKLPLVDTKGDVFLLGYDTETSMRSGVVFGIVAEVEGIMSAYESKYPDFNAILTGGDAPYFADKIKSKIFADPDLLLKGLNIIINHNASYLR